MPRIALKVGDRAADCLADYGKLAARYARAGASCAQRRPAGINCVNRDNPAGISCVNRDNVWPFGAVSTVWGIDATE
jgi:hypothetical protein